MTLEKSICAVVLTTLHLTVPAFGAGDTARGAQVFRACAACHSLDPGAHMTGPKPCQFIRSPGRNRRGLHALF